MTAPASLLADIRRLEAYAVRDGASDRWLSAVIPQLVALAMGVPPRRADAFVRARRLVAARECNVTVACRRVGLRRQTYYELLRICGHGSCEPRGKGDPMRTIKTISLPLADKVGVPQAANGKPPAPSIPTPRADGGMSTGKTGGNFNAGPTPPNATPAELLEKEGTGSV